MTELEMLDLITYVHHPACALPMSEDSELKIWDMVKFYGTTFR